MHIAPVADCRDCHDKGAVDKALRENEWVKRTVWAGLRRSVSHEKQSRVGLQHRSEVASRACLCVAGFGESGSSTKG